MLGAGESGKVFPGCWMKINGLLWTLVWEQDLEHAREEGKAGKQLELTLLGTGTVDIKPGQRNRLLGAQTLISAFSGVPGLGRGQGHQWGARTPRSCGSHSKYPLTHTSNKAAKQQGVYRLRFRSSLIENLPVQSFPGLPWGTELEGGSS